MDTQAYNGYTNYATWNVSLWIDNDPALYEYYRDQVAQMRSEMTSEAFTKEDGMYSTAECDLAKLIQNQFEEEKPKLEASTYSDLLTHALAQVEWREIAANMIEESEE